MLMMPITPKVMARPMAASSSTEPSESPYQAFCTVDQIASVCCTEPTAAVAAAFSFGGAFGGTSLSSAERVLIAALADGLDGGEAVFELGVGLAEQDGGARLR